jgi:hypothetical protein
MDRISLRCFFVGGANVSDGKKHFCHRNKVACGSKNADTELLVLAAFESDCDDCRVAVNVGRMSDKAWDGKTFGVSPGVAPYVPQPLESSVVTSKKRRKGRRLPR